MRENEMALAELRLHNQQAREAWRIELARQQQLQLRVLTSIEHLRKEGYIKELDNRDMLA